MNYIDKMPFTNSIKEKLENATNMLLKEITDINMIILFGSYARCEYKVGSDLDIAVLTTSKLSIEHRGGLASMLNEVDIDCVFYTDKEFEMSHSLLTKKIRRDGVLLWKS